MTRKLTLFFVCAFEIALILFVAGRTAQAKETIVNCGGQYFKHQHSIFSSNVWQRENGIWENWCKCERSALTVTEDSAICASAGGAAFCMQGNTLLADQKIVLDLLANKITFFQLNDEISYSCHDVE